MPGFIDLTGKKIGRYTVIERVANKGHNTCWLVRCDCGTVKEVAANNILRVRKSGITSCGCYHLERVRKPYGVSAFNRFVHEMRKNAKVRNIDIFLTDEQIREITSRNCVYCGQSPQEYKKLKRNGNYPHNGIDRVDSKKPYTLDNVVPCCPMCNRAKYTYSVDEFKEHIVQIYNHWASK